MIARRRGGTLRRLPEPAAQTGALDRAVQQHLQQKGVDGLLNEAGGHVPERFDQPGLVDDHYAFNIPKTAFDRAHQHVDILVREAAARQHRLGVAGGEEAQGLRSAGGGEDMIAPVGHHAAQPFQPGFATLDDQNGFGHGRFRCGDPPARARAATGRKTGNLDRDSTPPRCRRHAGG